MKRALIFTGLCFLFVGAIAQCTFNAVLNVAGSFCAGSAVLKVDGDHVPSKIVWYNGSVVVGNATAAGGGGRGKTVAGGNGDGTAADQLEGPESIFVDKAGNIYISDAANYRVEEWLAGSKTGIIVAGGNGQGTASDQLDGHASLYVDGGGNLYVADASNHRIQKWPPGAVSGQTVAGGNGQGPAADQFNTPEGIFVDKDMNIYVADAGNNRIQKWVPGAVSGLTVAGGNGQGAAADQFNVSSGVYLDGNGNIFVADYGNNRVQKWAPGAVAGITVAGGHGQGNGPDQLYGPESVWVDAADTVYVADLLNNRIQKWAPGGIGGITVAGGNGLGASASQLANPYDVNVDDSGNVYVADFGNNRVEKWARQSGIDTRYAAMDPGIYSAVVTDEAGCNVVTDAITIDVSPSVMAGNDTIIAPGRVVKLHPSVAGPVAVYRWTPSIGLDDPFIPDAMASPAQTTTYQLTVSTDKGCQASGKMVIQVYYILVMPSAFTPNGDGDNDLFRIPAALSRKIAYFRVYNRRGNRVFMTAGRDTGWDGTWNHQPQPAGTYIWEIGYENILNGRTERATGTVTLIR